MKTFFSIALLFFVLINTSCKKKSDDAQSASPKCNKFSPFELSATVDGNLFCADATLFADKAIVMTINGISQSTASLTLELDDFTPGTYTINNNKNHVLYTDPLAGGYESTNGNPGTLVISGNDTANNILTGTFNVTVQSPIFGNKKIENGVIHVFYTE